MADYEKYLNDTKKKDEKAIKLEEGVDDKKLYIRPGKYKVIIEASNGIKAEQTLEIRAMERRAGRRGEPMSAPDEFEER